MSGRRAPSRSTGATLLIVIAWPIAAWPQAEPAPPPPPPSLAEPRPPESTPETAPPPPPPSSPPVPALTPAPTPEEQTWIDASHRFLSRGFLWAFVRFDRFFADERDVDLPRTRSFVRWRNTLALRDDGRRSYAPDIRAEAVLPSLDRRLDRLRLRLAVATTTPDAVDPLLPPALQPPDVPNRPHAGLVLAPFRSLWAQTDFQTGALLRHRLGWYARARFRRVQPIGEAMVARLALAGFWQTDLGFGTRQELSLEHPISPWLLLRLAGSSMAAERSRGWEWSSELALLAAAWPRTALSLSGAALGASRAGPGVEVWRVQVRARHDIFRRWIFAEVAPESVWARGAGGRLQRASAVILRLEVQFDASSGPGPGRVPAPPEQAGAPRRWRQRMRSRTFLNATRTSRRPRAAWGVARLPMKATDTEDARRAGRAAGRGKVPSRSGAATSRNDEPVAFDRPGIALTFMSRKCRQERSCHGHVDSLGPLPRPRPVAGGAEPQPRRRPRAVPRR